MPQLVKAFTGPQVVYEVRLNEDLTLCCTCPSFIGLGDCVHLRLVSAGEIGRAVVTVGYARAEQEKVRKRQEGEQQRAEVRRRQLEAQRRLAQMNATGRGSDQSEPPPSSLPQQEGRRNLLL